MELTKLNQRTVSEQELDRAEEDIANLTTHMAMSDRVSHSLSLFNKTLR